jgi:class 3 adenylate cyclase
MSQQDIVSDSLPAARSAMERHAWREAFDLFATADAAGELSGADLEALAEAAWWTAQADLGIDAKERAFAAHVAAGDGARAAFVALRVALEYRLKGAAAVAAGWQGRAERVLQNEPECVAHGYLALAKGGKAEGAGDFAGADELYGTALDIGTRLGDRDLQAYALLSQGMVLVAGGRVEEGMALVDEATVAAVAGELGAYATGIVYCNTISVCRDLADYRRAGDWTEAAQRWCQRLSITGFPGVCRVHRAEIIALRGAWNEAERELRQACGELAAYNATGGAADGFYAIGEIRLRMGDLEGAGEAFREAHALGHETQPGMALLELARGAVDVAGSSIRGALADTPSDLLTRARLLPAQVEIAVAADDVPMARAASEELTALAETYGSPALHARAHDARGMALLAEGDAAGSVRESRLAVRHWQEVDAPYEVARARVGLAAAYRAQGDEQAARLELETARAAFERLGAEPDARNASEGLGDTDPTGGAATRRAMRTFMFTDIVKSTNLLEAIGDEAWADLLKWHDQTLRSMFAAHSGEEIDHAGDGFFVSFPDAASATECAVDIQRTLRDHRGKHGFAPQVRVGLHASEANQRGQRYSGKGVHEAARIGALAKAGEILASEGTAAETGARFALSDPRPVDLKGISGPVTVVSVEWR